MPIPSDLTEDQKSLECFRIGDLTGNKKETQRSRPRERRRAENSVNTKTDDSINHACVMKLPTNPNDGGISELPDSQAHGDQRRGASMQRARRLVAFPSLHLFNPFMINKSGCSVSPSSVHCSSESNHVEPSL